MRPSAVVGGVAGPAAFIAAWAVLGEHLSGYSPVDDPISRLAAVGAPTRWAMTAGMLALGAGIGLFGRGLADEGHREAALAATVTAAATVGIAATPLDSALGGAPHAAAAGLAYASLVAVPALAARDLVRDGEPRRAGVAIGLATASALSLTASLAVEGRMGLWQRLGLTLGHLWIAGHALRARRR